MTISLRVLRIYENVNKAKFTQVPKMEEIKQKLSSQCPAVQESAVRRLKEKSTSEADEAATGMHR